MRLEIQRLSWLSGLFAVALTVWSVQSGAVLAQSATKPQGQSVPEPQTPAVTAPPPPADPAVRVAEVLMRFCPTCVEAGLGTALELGDLASDPALVTPKQPDASPVYQQLLAVQMSVETEPNAKPSPADVEIVRDWIDGLPLADEACAGRVPVSPGEMQKLASSWLKSLSDEEAADTRFLSLAHLYSACVAEKRLAQSREALGVLLKALGRNSEPAHLETLGDASAVIAVRLSQIGITAGRWAHLIDGAPPLIATAVPGDWLAARVLSHPRGAGGAIDPAFDAPMFAKDEARVMQLAQLWRRDVTLQRAAVEIGMESAELAEKLHPFSGDLGGSAMRLLQGALPRADWDDLKIALEGAEPLPRKHELNPSHIDVAIWTDKPTYKVGDLVEISVAADRPCYLTLINVDRDGKAIVLFPNDLERDNLVAARVAVKVPGSNAGYQLRLERAGMETLVAQCQRSGPRMAGLAPDYEKQRFTILGDWRKFLRTAAEREAVYLKSQERRSRRGKRDRDDDEAPAAATPSSTLDNPTLQGRSAVRLTIE